MTTLALAEQIARRRDDCRQTLAELLANTPTPQLICKMRNDFGAELASLLLDVARLQPKARRKFGEGHWWVTGRSLQQATAWQVATLKATWLGDFESYDLCCGIGGDAMRLAARATVTAVDCDPLMAEMARMNVSQPSDLHPVDVVCADVVEISLPDRCRLHIDPDRRPQSKRTSSPEHYRPPWEDVMRLTARASASLVKLAPAARLPEPMPRSHRAWISLAGSVREQTLLCGDTLETAGLDSGRVSAWMVRPDGTTACFTADTEGAMVQSVSKPQRFLVDPDAAIRAAGLTEAFAARHHLCLLAGPAGFLTGDQIDAQACGKFGVVHEVLWVGSADDRKLRRELRSRDRYPVTIKVRGTDHDPSQLTKRYRKCGSRAVVLWIGRAGERVFAAMTEPHGATSNHES